MRFTKPVCSTCGSDDVRADAYATFDPVTQEWVLATTFDKGAVCEKCGGETTLEDEPLEGDELNQARAYELARNDGWRPGDEDTAVEYCDAYDLDYQSPIEGESE